MQNKKLNLVYILNRALQKKSYYYYLQKLTTMKRILALFLFVGAVTVASAQSSRNQSRDIVLGRPNSVYGNNNRNNNYGSRNNDYYSIRERDAQIERIKREYDWKIRNVYNDRYLRNSAKKRKVRMLEDERNDRIREVMQRYNQSSRSDRYGRRY